jgi:hypothetical protein
MGAKIMWDLFTTFENLKTKVWFLNKHDLDYGPFSKLEVIQMLQEKVILPQDLIKSANDKAEWQVLANVPEFRTEKIRSLQKILPTESTGVFFKRQHARKQYDCSLIIHNHKSVYSGESVEISAGGAGLVLNSAQIQTGQVLLIHFQPGGGVPPFNAVCKVVSKLPSKDQYDDTFTKYGVTFTSISSTIRSRIREFAQETQKAAL